MLEAVSPLVEVDVAALAAWVASIPFDDWPQQRRRKPGMCRPAMVNTDWRGLYSRTNELVEHCLTAVMRRTGSRALERPISRMLSVVMPGDWISPHVDQQPDGWLCRVHVPLLTNALATFTADGVAFLMPDGWAYRVDTRRQHSVENAGDSPRVHFMFDVVAYVA